MHESEVYIGHFPTGQVHNARFIMEAARCREAVANGEMTQDEAQRRTEAAYRIGALAQILGEPYMLTSEQMEELHELDERRISRREEPPKG